MILKKYEEPTIEITRFGIRESLMTPVMAAVNSSESMTEIDNEATADWEDW